MRPAVRLIGLTQPFEDPDYADPLGFTKPEDLIEYAGRWDYGERSIARMGEPGIIGRWLASGEESMIEMVNAAFLITCSRVVSHELVRHRIATYQQESQRFVEYSEETIDALFFTPEVAAGDGGSEIDQVYTGAVGASLIAYQELRRLGVSKQDARYVLPNATRVRMVANMNLRQWRHVLLLRMHTSAQPEMRMIAALIFGKLFHQFPEIFADIPDRIAKGREAR